MKMTAARTRTRALGLLLGALVFAALLAGCGAGASTDPDLGGPGQRPRVFADDVSAPGARAARDRRV